MRPTRTALLVALCWLGLGIAAAFVRELQLPFLIAGGSLVVLALIDVITLMRRPPPTLTRALPHVMAVGERYAVELSLHSDRKERVVVHDHTPESGVAEGLPATLQLLPDRIARLSYHFRPTSRGLLRFPTASVLFTGTLGLLEQERRIGESADSRVYPNFRRVAAHASAGEAALYQGAQLQRRRGQGMEFHQLREYREGDSPRAVDWKAVARRRQMISREYRSEQNQNVVFLLDCGRRMRAQDGELSLLDQALDALLLLSYVALRQGDSVGVLTFSGVSRWLPPVRGAGGLQLVLQTIYDLQSSTEPTDFEEGVARLSARQRRRALIVVLTNLNDHDARALSAPLLTLRERHMVMVASLREPELRLQLEQPVQTLDDGMCALSTLGYLDARRAARNRLSAGGIHTLEAEPAALPRQLVEQYLRIKRAGSL
jgi:uncharacterized protein (DUF58 family)